MHSSDEWRSFSSPISCASATSPDAQPRRTDPQIPGKCQRLRDLTITQLHSVKAHGVPDDILECYEVLQKANGSFGKQNKAHLLYPVLPTRICCPNCKRQLSLLVLAAGVSLSRLPAPPLSIHLGDHVYGTKCYWTLTRCLWRC